MAETRWTPGPWEARIASRSISGASVHSAEGPRIALAQLTGQHPDTPANAHLISAGPTMYAALEDALAAMESMSPPILTHPAMESVRDALAKARGETPEPVGDLAERKQDSGADEPPPA